MIPCHDTRVKSIVVLTGICLLMATPAYAYVDPGTGSLLVQIVTGGVAGLFVLGRLWWSRIKDKFGKKPQVR
jgi:hypothetical protein